MNGYGRGSETSANTTLLIAVLLLALVGWMLATGYDSAQARCRTQGTRCERTGRTYNVHGELVEEGLWWGKDGERHGVKS